MCELRAPGVSEAITVVIATRERRQTLLETLDRLTVLAERPPIVVVDNASQDGTVAAVRARHPRIRVLGLPTNLGAAARNVGVRAALTPLVAFCDDDSWWAPGALARAARDFAEHPRLGLLAARVLVGDEQRLDPTCTLMARGAPAEPGPAIFGFVACGAIVRRDAFLAAGGFEQRLGIGAEEGLLAMDLAAAGWSLAYVADVVVHHHPAREPRPGRQRRVARNDLWISWLRRPTPVAARMTLAALHPRRVLGLLDALGGIGWVVRNRRPLPPSVEQALRRVTGS